MRLIASFVFLLACGDSPNDAADGAVDSSFADQSSDAAGEERAFADADAGPCPTDMTFVRSDAGVCVDLYEGALQQTAPDGGVSPWPFFDPIDNADASTLRAVVAKNIFPQGYISQLQAAAMCANSGKRLCTLEEWTAACRGQPDHDYTYPYGDTYDPTACNEGRESPIIRLYGPSPSYDYSELNDPQDDQLDAGLARGGSFPKCVSTYGAFDMHGNLHEWVDDGSFVGGYFVDAKLNGPGCEYRTTAHAKTYHDYSTGFRCCRDPQ